MMKAYQIPLRDSLFMFTFLLFHASLVAQSSNLWSISGGGTGNDGIFCTEVDRAGSVIVAGYFEDVLQIAGVSPIYSKGEGDTFLAKYLADGTLFWLVRLGGEGSDVITDIVTDNDGNIYVLGNFQGSIEMGSIDNLPIAEEGTAKKTFFLAKYNGNGIVQWGRAGNVYYGDDLFYSHTAYSLDIFENGKEMIITGYLEAEGDEDVFLYRFGDRGDLLEGYASFGNSPEIGTGVQYDLEGNIILTGFFDGSIDMINSDEELYGNLAELFVAKYTRDLDLIWAKSAGSNGQDASGDVAIGPNNDIFITGLCQNNASFGPYIIQTNGGQDFFVAKYNKNGDIQWVKSGGSDGNDLLSNIKVDSDGALYMIGSFENACSFDYNTHTVFSNEGSRDIIVIKYDNNGAVEWYKTLGGIKEDTGGDIAISNNRIVVGGAFSNSIQLNNRVVSNGGQDFFVTILNEEGGIVSSTESIIASHINLYPNPVSETLFIDDVNNDNISAIEIYSVSGKLQQSIGNYDGKGIDVSGYSTGMYIFKAVSDEGIIIKNFVVHDDY